MRVPVRHLSRLARAYGARSGALGGQQGAHAPAAAAGAAALQLVRGRAQAALAVEQRVAQAVIPEIKTDLFGAVSPVEGEGAVQEGVFENKDGHRYAARVRRQRGCEVCGSSGQLAAARPCQRARRAHGAHTTHSSSHSVRWQHRRQTAARLTHGRRM
jgi:hypothetical protein